MANSVTKADFVSHMAAKSGISKSNASAALDALIEAIEKALTNSAAGDGVRVPGLGTFTVRQRAARAGRNPQTGQPIQIAASKSVGFKAAKNLKDAAAA